MSTYNLYHDQLVEYGSSPEKMALIKAVYDIADDQDNYENGWDVVAECWEPEKITQYIGSDEDCAHDVIENVRVAVETIFDRYQDIRSTVF